MVKLLTYGAMLSRWSMCMPQILPAVPPIGEPIHCWLAQEVGCSRLSSQLYLRVASLYGRLAQEVGCPRLSRPLSSQLSPRGWLLQGVGCSRLSRQLSSQLSPRVASLWLPGPGRRLPAAVLPAVPPSGVHIVRYPRRSVARGCPASCPFEWLAYGWLA